MYNKLCLKFIRVASELDHINQPYLSDNMLRLAAGLNSGNPVSLTQPTQAIDTQKTDTQKKLQDIVMQLNAMVQALSKSNQPSSRQYAQRLYLLSQQITTIISTLNDSNQKPSSAPGLSGIKTINPGNAITIQPGDNPQNRFYISKGTPGTEIHIPDSQVISGQEV